MRLTKFISLGLLACIMVGNGLVSSHAQSKERLISATFYGGPLQATWEYDSLQAYQSDHPDLEIIRQPTALYQAPVPLRSLERHMSAETPPDVVSGFIGGSLLREYIKAGKIADISDLWQANGWLDHYPQSVIDFVSYEGKQYFLPQGVQWHPVFYNTAVFEAHNLAIPTTWDELLTTCETLYAAGIAPFTFAATGWTPPATRWFTILDLRLNGAAFHDDLMAGRISYHDERVRDVFTTWQSAFEHHCFAEDAITVNYGEAVRRLTSGEAAMYYLGEWLYESLAEGDAEHLDFFRFPTLNPDIPNAEMVHYYGSYILTGATNPTRAREFLTWLGSTERQASIVTEVGRAVTTNQVDSALLPDYQQRGVQFIAESGPMSILFENDNLNASMATLGLNQMVAFVRSWQEPDRIDIILDILEAERVEAMGQ